MTLRDKVSAWSSLFVAVMNTLVAFYLFVSDWWLVFETEIAHGRPDEAEIVRWILPGLNDLIMIGGVIWLMAAYGFFTHAKWASSAGVIASVVSMVGAFFWMIPPASRGLFPSYLWIFLANMAGWAIMALHTRRLALWVAGISLLAGMTYVLTFMNGIASTDRIIVTGRAIYVAAQRLNWASAVAWGVAVIGMIHLKPWARLLGIGAGVLGFLAGAPLAYATMQASGTFSMFAPAPAMGLLLAILFALPRFAQRYDQHCETTTSAAQPQG